MTDTELKLALAKMLPEKFIIAEGKLLWRPEDDAPPDDEDGGYFLMPVADTELLHVCHLIERTLHRDELFTYSLNLGNFRSDIWNDLPITATWQQRAEALIKGKGVK